MSKPTNYASLQDLLDAKENLAEYFYNDTRDARYRNRPSPIPDEVTNWRDEQRAWRESVLLFDQSHHMPETFIKGPDAVKLLSSLGINTFNNFEPLRAKQYVGCNHKGQVIGECIVQHHEDGTYELISGMMLQNWVEYNAKIHRYDVDLRRDHSFAENDNRTFYRYQLEGPYATDLLADVIEGEMPEIKFFRMARVTIQGMSVLVLRHGMTGHKGVELSGPYDEGEKIRSILLEAGKKYNVLASGRKTYFSTLGEAGWIGYPTPAVYTDPKLADYRKYLPSDGWEAYVELGGSFRSRNIEDYYMTPWDLGLQHLIKFDHDFVGREALEEMSERSDNRKKMTLVWNNDDVMRIYASLFTGDVPFKYMELPKSSYAFQQADEVRSMNGELVGLSNFVGYTVNEAKFLSVCIINPEYAEPGTEVEVVWGEPDGGSRKLLVEKHQQTKVRAVVAPAPYARQAQTGKNADIAGKK